MKITSVFVLFFLGLQSCVFGQNGWTWTELPNMPEAVSNHAVTSAFSGDSLCIYSFCGIDESKTPAGIHLKSWRYNTVSQFWTQLEDVPDFQGKIAASATTVNNKIYLIGGYYVDDDFSELSSDDVHIFDPETNSWFDDGALIPTPIDDHVYGLWRDSLIFVITGWSDTQNVRDVQIYDPTENQWTQANDLPITNSYPVFGASGNIINDTIFYLGGVNNSFSTMSRMRRGIIQNNDPTDIIWDVVGEAPSGDSYRTACAVYDDRLFFIGGSDDGYNFDGISYTSDIGVENLSRIVTYYSQWEHWEEEEAPYGIMDLRGISKLSETSWIICGGMMEDQEVSDRVFLLELDPSVGIEDQFAQQEIRFCFNSESKILNYTGLSDLSKINIYDASGRLIDSFIPESSEGTHKCKNLNSGLFLVHNTSLLDLNPAPITFINY